MKLENSKPIKIVMTVLRTIFTAILIVFILVVCLQRFSGNRLSLFNYRMFTVVSGSMKPKYVIGDVLIAKEVKPSKIKIGDTISYLGNSGDFSGKVITHQVIGINKDTNGKYIYRAKGLANLVEDPYVSENQLYGVVVYKSFVLSLIYKIIGNKIGFYLFIIIPLMLIIGSEFVTTLLEKEETRRNKLKNKED